MPTTFDYETGKLTVTVSAAQIAEVEQTMKAVASGTTVVLRTAINDTLRWTRTEGGRRVREDVNLRARDVREHIRVTKQAKGQDLQGVVTFDYKPVPLEDFRAKWSPGSPGTKVTTVLTEGQKLFRHMFRATMASGHVGVFQRVKGAAKVLPKSGRYAGKVIGPRKRTIAAGKYTPEQMAAQIASGKRRRNRRTRRLVQREGKPILRQPIKETFGPAVTSSFTFSDRLGDAFLQDVDAKLAERIGAKMQWQLEKASAAEPPV